MVGSERAVAENLMEKTQENLRGKDIISIDDLTAEDISEVLAQASAYDLNRHLNKGFDGRRVALCFFEPSTRTYTSFEKAVNDLGGKTYGFRSPAGTSIEKGESFEDTIKTYDCYGIDAIIVRDKNENSPMLASSIARVPVINAGNGADEHPTQALLDLYTIWKRKGSFQGLKIGILGDLKYGRAAHSLALGLRHFDVSLYLISQKELMLGERYKSMIESSGTRFHEVPHTDLKKVAGELDVFYVMRLQSERIEDSEEKAVIIENYPRVDASILDANKRLMIMHPFPRGRELSRELDTTPNAAYFEQMENSIPLRQALLSLIFKEK